ncbi:uncharacterized protein [Centroberyx affinis]|uniref:uncharacterized protein n=1 Tax=Centroberyx affinis TaxID=166261 RepID=UPI003A5BD46C
MVDDSVRLEALSALLGASIKQQKFTPLKPTRPITVDDYVISAILGYKALLGEESPNLPTPDQSSSTTDSSQNFGVKRELFVDVEDFFDSSYDCDFSNFSWWSASCMRGDEEYKRPVGWYRMALKVQDKYPDGNTWLGPNGMRHHSARGEWPVSYHGTSLEGAKGIIKSHYKAGPRAVHGRGIYSTPSLDSADEYATRFTSETTGKTYRVIMQNRINPKERFICQKKEYWLIPVPDGSSRRQEKEIVERSIRPYGILIQEVTESTCLIL